MVGWLVLLSSILMASATLGWADNLVDNGAMEGPAGDEGLPPGWMFGVVGEKSSVKYDADAKCVSIENVPKETTLKHGLLELNPEKRYRLT